MPSCLASGQAGYYVYGGWAQTGLFMLFTEIYYALYERIYWQIWGLISHAGAEEIAFRSREQTLNEATGIAIILRIGITLLLLIPARKLRKYPVGQNIFAKIAVGTYLFLGCMPFSARTGFERENRIPVYMLIAFYGLLFFFVIIILLREVERRSRHLLQLRQYAFAA